MAKAKIANKNLTLVYQNIEPNLELKLFVNGKLTYVMENCPNNSNLTAKIVDLEDRYRVQLNLATEQDLIFAAGDDEVIAAALEKAMNDLSAKMHFWDKARTGTISDYELF